MMITITLTDNNIKQFDETVKQEMTKSLQHFEHDLISIRTGRAHPSLVEDILITCYDATPMKIKEIASVTIPDARTLMISPWDKHVLKDVEKGILQSDLGVTPINDGEVVRINLPEMSTQRREELAKVLGKKLEDARIRIRNVRKEFNNLIRDALKDKTISEDHQRRLNDHLQEITDNMIYQAEQTAERKKKEITTI